MSRRVAKYCNLINFLLSLKPTSTQFKVILTSLQDDQVNILSEIAVNILYGRLPISLYQKKRLKPFKEKIVILASPDKTVKERKRIIQHEPVLVHRLLSLAQPLLKCLGK